MAYRRPGVYLEESLLLNPSDVAGTTTVAAFIGLAPKGPINTPYLCESWTDYSTLFGDFDPIPPWVPTPSTPTNKDTTTLHAGGDSTVYTDLNDLKTDGIKGDGHYTGPAFTAGQYALMNPASDVTGQRVHYRNAVWASGAFPDATPPSTRALSYLPFAVYSFFQNGGRFAWVVRAVSGTGGANSTADVVSSTTGNVFTLSAVSPGKWGDSLGYRVLVNDLPEGADETTPRTFSLEIDQNMAPSGSNIPAWEVMERFMNLSVKGEIAGTKRVDSAVNDSLGGSRLVRVTNLDLTKDVKAQTDVAPFGKPTGAPDGNVAGADPAWPGVSDFDIAADTLGQVEGPIIVNYVGYLDDEAYRDKPGNEDDEGNKHFLGVTFAPLRLGEREDVMSLNDNCFAKPVGVSATNYYSTMKSDLSVDSSSYTAAYGPWIFVPHPTQIGSVIPMPPGGAVLGVMARVDATIGYHRAPAGVIATLSNSVGVQAKFTDNELGDLNFANINIIRPVVGAGICVMGARTRKPYGPDHYISARRTLINLKEQLRRSTQWAVFENNDERLWSGLRITADNILRPLWERGGLRGASPQQAYYIRCDSSLNTINVISSGEVRMEIGVALQYPAEFVIIRITQITSNQFNNEIQPV